ncbi:hypothetical protein [Bifidobacterium moukalabense]|uniref:hypothetical protein n=1 Tax=Bifidobacterium moukalabense TaxID=1333651 RepID=UPI0010F571BA|nr:hypothetical protein [Bifidobacterium moukalabense]
MSWRTVGLTMYRFAVDVSLTWSQVFTFMTGPKCGSPISAPLSPSHLPYTRTIASSPRLRTSQQSRAHISIQSSRSPVPGATGPTYRSHA